MTLRHAQHPGEIVTSQLSWYRAIAVDFDGTLTTGGRPAAEVRALGARLLLVTGRILDELRAVFPDAEHLFDAVVAENGAVVSRAAGVRSFAEPVAAALDAALAVANAVTSLRERSPVAIPASGVNVLFLGISLSGKSYGAGLLAEGLIARGYSVCVLDPEGDHLGLRELHGCMTVGGDGSVPDFCLVTYQPDRLCHRARAGFDMVIEAPGDGKARGTGLGEGGGSRRYTGRSASNLGEFSRELRACSAAVVEHHVENHDFSRWTGDVIQDSELSQELRRLELKSFPQGGRCRRSVSARTFSMPSSGAINSPSRWPVPPMRVPARDGWNDAQRWIDWR